MTSRQPANDTRLSSTELRNDCKDPLRRLLTALEVPFQPEDNLEALMRHYLTATQTKRAWSTDKSTTTTTTTTTEASTEPEQAITEQEQTSKSLLTESKRLLKQASKSLLTENKLWQLLVEDKFVNPLITSSDNRVLFAAMPTSMAVAYQAFVRANATWFLLVLLLLFIVGAIAGPMAYVGVLDTRFSLLAPLVLPLSFHNFFMLDRYLVILMLTNPSMIYVLFVLFIGCLGGAAAVQFDLRALDAVVLWIGTSPFFLNDAAQSRVGRITVFVQLAMAALFLGVAYCLVTSGPHVFTNHTWTLFGDEEMKIVLLPFVAEKLCTVAFFCIKNAIVALAKPGYCVSLSAPVRKERVTQDDDHVASSHQRLSLVVRSSALRSWASRKSKQQSAVHPVVKDASEASEDFE